MSLRADRIEEHKLDRRHRWTIAGVPEDVERTATCRACRAVQAIYGTAWLAKFFTRLWADVPRACYFGRFLSPGALVRRRGQTLQITRRRTLNLPGRAG